MFGLKKNQPYQSFDFSPKLFLLFIVIIVFCFWRFYYSSPKDFSQENFNEKNLNNNEQNFDVSTIDWLKKDKNIDLSLLVSNEQVKETAPVFASDFLFRPITELSLNNNSWGVLVQFGDQSKFYPDNFLLTKKVINDQIADNYFSVSFCDACSANGVFNRKIDGQILTFSQSNYTYQENLVLKSEENKTLWSQISGEAMVGDFVGAKLSRLPSQIITFGQAKEKYPKTSVIDFVTSNRSSLDNYQKYLQEKKLSFVPVVVDSQFSDKESMVAFFYQGKPMVFPRQSLAENKSQIYQLNDGKSLSASNENGEIKIIVDDQVIPSYQILWFCWVVNYYNQGIVWVFK